MPATLTSLAFGLGRGELVAGAAQTSRVWLAPTKQSSLVKRLTAAATPLPEPAGCQAKQCSDIEPRPSATLKNHSHCCGDAAAPPACRPRGHHRHACCALPEAPCPGTPTCCPGASLVAADPPVAAAASPAATASACIPATEAAGRASASSNDIAAAASAAAAAFSSAAFLRLIGDPCAQKQQSIISQEHTEEILQQVRR